MRAIAAALGLAVSGVAAAATVTVKAGTYTGSTQQSLPVSFKVSKGGLEVTNFEPTFTASCDKPGGPAKTTPQITTDAGRDITIKSGRFANRGLHGKLHSGGTVIATGTDRLTGSFGPGRTAHGTYSATLVFKRGAPDQLGGYHCRTGPLTWTASRR
jgi:hypothetical protein